MNRDRLDDHIDIRRSRILSLLHDLGFVNKIFNRFILEVSNRFIVHGVDIENFNSDKLLTGLRTAVLKKLVHGDTHAQYDGKRKHTLYKLFHKHPFR